MVNCEVSIITASYNSKQFIKDTIESVLAQTYTDWEMIIVDDCSTDDSVQYIEELIQHEPRIRLIVLKENQGAAVSRNRATQEAKGRYIAFLDSDDMWMPQKLEKQVAFMQQHDIALSYTGYYSISEEEGKIIKEISVPSRIDYHELLKQNIIGCLTAMYNSQKLGKILMPDLRKRQDYALWLKILKQIPYAMGIKEPLAYYRVRKSSLSANKIRSSLYNWKMYRKVEKLPLYKAIYYFGWYTYRILKKYT